MKKDLKSKSKRKWIVGGVLLFGGVALLTTGFATWAIGVNQTKQNLGTNVSVQGTVNESVKLTVTPVSGDDNAMGVSISESHKTQAADEIFYTKDEKPTDFNIKVKVVVEIGAEFYANNNITNVTFDFKDWAQDENKPNGYDSSKDVTSKRKVNVRETTKTHAEGNYTYIDIDTEATTLTIPTLNSDHTLITGLNPNNFVLGSGSSTTKSKVFTIEALDLKVFKWGTFFGNGSSPCEYYNGLYQEEKITSQADDVDLVYAEMNAMKAALQPDDLTTTNIYLTATLNASPKA